MAEFWYDLGVNLLSDLVIIVATYYIVGRLLDRKIQQQKLAEAKPIAKEAIGFRLWPMLRIVMMETTKLTLTPTSRLSRADVFFAYVQEDHYKFIFEQTEKLVEIYGDRIPDDIQQDLIDFSYHAGELCESIAHIKVNWEILPHLEEWGRLKSDAQNLVSEVDDLVKKLVDRDLLSNEIGKRYQEGRNQIVSVWRGEGYPIPYGKKGRARTSGKKGQKSS